MGGNAFSTGPDPLHTPRMPLPVYETARARVHKVLRELFAAVATPVEGPGKVDFGDVDVDVAQPRKQDGADVSISELLQMAARRLGAVHTISSETKMQLAMPWPSSEEEPAGVTGPMPFVQVDIDIAPTMAAFHWALFKHGHGDFWNILGAVIRPLGLTVDESAMWLRIVEIERHNRKLAKVFLTNTPAEVMEFLGLDLPDGIESSQGLQPSIWEQPFADAWQLFEYVARSPYFVLPPTGKEGDEEEEMAGQSKANDRRRMRFRPLFRKWATEYVPAWRERQKTTAAADKHITRDTVRAEVFARFPSAEAVYESTRTAWLAEQQARAVWAAAKAAIPTDLPGRYRAVACAAVKQRLLQGPQVEGGLTNTDDPTTCLAKWSVEGAIAFAAAHWQALAAEAAPDTQ